MDSFQENFNFKSYLSSRLIKINLAFCLLVNILIWLILAWQAGNFSGSIILHYNIYFGIDWLGEWYNLFLPPAIGSLIILINFVLARLFFNREKILSYFLVFSSSLVQILILLAGLAVIFINL